MDDDRQANPPGLRPLIWCIVMIAGLLGAYAVARPVVAVGAATAHHLSINTV